ncbi:MAG: hypothetical protein ACOYMA_14220 [Bacteroidia bacterium]
MKEIFVKLLLNYTNNIGVINELWTEIELNYSSKNRHYHSLSHLENLFTQLSEIKDEIQNWEAILFTLFYHDIVYNSQGLDNEEKSAELAELRMRQIAVDDDTMALCKAQILATKSHLKSTHSDTNYFTDADLSVLGQSWDIYSLYANNVRKEYSIYADLIYNPGRQKVLNHFLSLESIFKTDFFYHKFEKQAKQNLQREIEMLG